MITYTYISKLNLVQIPHILRCYDTTILFSGRYSDLDQGLTEPPMTTWIFSQFILPPPLLHLLTYLLIDTFAILPATIPPHHCRLASATTMLVQNGFNTDECQFSQITWPSMPAPLHRVQVIIPLPPPQIHLAFPITQYRRPRMSVTYPIKRKVLWNWVVINVVARLARLCKSHIITSQRQPFRQHNYSDQICYKISFKSIPNFPCYQFQMDPDQLQMVVIANTDVTAQFLLFINPTKLSNSFEFTRCKASINQWAAIISALINFPIKALIFRECDLNVSQNKCQSIAELGLYRLHNISSLTISGCNLNQATISLVTQLKNLTKLRIQEEHFTLKFKSQDIQGIKQRKLSIMYKTNLASISQLPVKRDLESIFESLPDLTKLTIKNHAFSNKEFKSIQKLQNLTKLKITGTFEEGQWFSCICSLRNLKKLIIQCDSDILQISGSYFEEIQNLRYFKKLVLNSNSEDYATYVIDHAIPTLPNVTQLDLCHNQFGDDGLEELSKMKSLQVLKLDRTLKITKHGLAFLSNLLNLQQLSLENDSRYSSFSIDAVGAAHLSKLVNLKKLNLYNHRIGDEGAKHISKIHSLRELYLDDNGITNYGVPALCRIPNLEILSLNSNKIGNDEVWELSKLTKLRKVSLAYCKFNALDRLYKVASLRQLVYSNCADGDKVRFCHIKKRRLKVQILEFGMRI